MKFFKLFALLLIVPLAIGVTSCGKKTEEKPQTPAVDSAKVQDQKPALTKEGFMKILNDMGAFQNSEDFKNIVRNAVKEVVKDPAVAKDYAAFEAKMNEMMKPGFEAKSAEIMKANGFNSMEEFGAAAQSLGGDPEIVALNEKITKETATIIFSVYEEADIAKILPKELKKKIAEEKKKMTQPAEEPKKGEEPKKEEPKKGEKKAK